MSTARWRLTAIIFPLQKSLRFSFLFFLHDNISPMMTSHHTLSSRPPEIVRKFPPASWLVSFVPLYRFVSSWNLVIDSSMKREKQQQQNGYIYIYTTHTQSTGLCNKFSHWIRAAEHPLFKKERKKKTSEKGDYVRWLFDSCLLYVRCKREPIICLGGDTQQ